MKQLVPRICLTFDNDTYSTFFSPFAVLRQCIGVSYILILRVETPSFRLFKIKDKIASITFFHS